MFKIREIYVSTYLLTFVYCNYNHLQQQQQIDSCNQQALVVNGVCSVVVLGHFDIELNNLLNNSFHMDYDVFVVIVVVVAVVVVAVDVIVVVVDDVVIVDLWYLNLYCCCCCLCYCCYCLFDMMSMVV